LLAGPADLLLDLLLRALVHLLDPRRMDPAVRDPLLERHAGRLPPHGVEAGEHDGLRRVIDDQIDARRRLERADVPPLASDDATLHVLGREREDRDRRLGGLLGRDPLDCDRHDLARSLFTLLPGPLLDLPNRGHRLALGVVDDLAHERLLGLLSGHPRHRLELRPMLLRGLLELLANALELPVAIVELLGPPIHLRKLSLEGLLPLAEPLLLPLDLLPPGADLLVRVAAHAADLLL